MTVYDWHNNWAWFVVISNGVAGAWALAAHRFTVLRSTALWWFTGVAQVSILVQAILGAILVKRDGYELPRFHSFYGFIALAAVGIIYSYRNQLKSKVYLLYGGGGLFVMGLCIRAMVLHE